MKIFDTHIHIWDTRKSPYKWLQHAPPLLGRTYTLPELEPARLQAGITDGILVQADNTIEDTQLMLEAAKLYQWIRGVVGWLPLMDTKRTQTLIEKEWLHNEYLVGMRHLIHDEQDAQWLLQPAVIKSLEVLAANDIPFDVVGVLPDHIKTAIAVNSKIPGLRMVFDHLNQPPIKTRERFGKWGTLMQTAAEKEKFYIKISGLGVTAGVENFTVEDIEPYIDFALKTFGVERCFCGGDWPVCLLGKDYVTTWHLYKTVLGKLLLPDEYEAVLYNNAAKFYKL